MNEAIQIGSKNRAVAKPNPSVGCLIVDSMNQEITRSCTEAYPGRHAERLAFEQVRELGAWEKLKGASLYTTLEPCSHFGNQPPCSQLLINSPIKKIFIACRDPNPLVNGRGIRELKDAGKEVHLGLLTKQALAEQVPFFIEQIHQRPALILKWAQTLDGQLADEEGNSKWISSEKARARGYLFREIYDFILIGVNTLLLDHPRLKAHRLHRDPIPIILDPKGRLGLLSEKTLTESLKQSFPDGRVGLVLGPPVGPISEKLARLGFLGVHYETLMAQENADFFECALNFINSAPAFFLAALGRKAQSIYVEGGAKTLTALIKREKVDLIHAFISPKITGGKGNRLSVGKLLSQASELVPLKTEQIQDDQLLTLMPKQKARELELILRSSIHN